VTILLDVNVLIALVVEDHSFHEVVDTWFESQCDEQGAATAFATTPITEGALVRFIVRNGGTPAAVAAVLDGIESRDGHEFWPDDLPFRQISMAGVIGHRQVTDAYLAALARAHGEHIATLNHGLALTHPDVALLIS